MSGKGCDFMARKLCVLLTLMPLVFAAMAGAAQQKTFKELLDGFWQSDAYGLLVEIRGADMTTSQITSISCLPWWTAKRSDASGKKDELVYKRGDAAILLTPGSTSESLTMRETTCISSMTL